MAENPLDLPILWGRLVAIADEAAATLSRTAFSTILREANDFVTMLLDMQGQSVAENSTAAPAFIGCLPLTLGHVLKKYPTHSWRPGDVVITNDPWIASGHLPDITVFSPIFVEEHLVAFAACMAHHADMGGALWSAATQELYEEGLRIPIARLYREGIANEALLDLLQANVRVPEQVTGDLSAQLAALDTLARRVVEFTAEAGVEDLSALAADMQSRSEQAMRRAIHAIPSGRYSSRVAMDGFDEPLTIALTIEVAGSSLTLDYAGTSPQVRRAINVPINNTFSHSAYALKCILDPHAPRNDGSYRPICVEAPLGCLLNPSFPAAVNGRHVTFLFLSAAIFQALAPVLPDRIIAECGSPHLQLSYYGEDHDGAPFIYVPFDAPGMGARPGSDGLSATPYAHNTGGASVEVVENMAPLVVWRKALIPDSGGPGRYRGGLGQELLVEVRSRAPVTLSVLGDRIKHPAHGVLGGLPGAPASILLNGIEPIDPKGVTVLNPGDQVLIRMAGGGGYGSPAERDRALIARDLRRGLITSEAARRDYGYAE